MRVVAATDCRLGGPGFARLLGYGPLRDPALFVQARVDPEVATVVWPNGADFDPATLHDWPEHEAAFRALAQRWEPAHA